jgi:hypothetical protein
MSEIESVAKTYTRKTIKSEAADMDKKENA